MEILILWIKTLPQFQNKIYKFLQDRIVPSQSQSLQQVYSSLYIMIIIISIIIINELLSIEQPIIEQTILQMLMSLQDIPCLILQTIEELTQNNLFCLLILLFHKVYSTSKSRRHTMYLMSSQKNQKEQWFRSSSCWSWFLRDLWLVCWDMRYLIIPSLRYDSPMM